MGNHKASKITDPKKHKADKKTGDLTKTVESCLTNIRKELEKVNNSNCAAGIKADVKRWGRTIFKLGLR